MLKKATKQVHVCTTVLIAAFREVPVVRSYTVNSHLTKFFIQLLHFGLYIFINLFYLILAILISCDGVPQLFMFLVFLFTSIVFRFEIQRTTDAL